MKVIEFSTDLKTWQTFVGPGPDEMMDAAWQTVQVWIQQEQPYGFFRMIDFFFIPPDV